MSSIENEFLVILQSNVKGHPRNKPVKFETTQAKPLDLPGDWEVALIDLSYPHNWLDYDKPIQFLMLVPEPRLNNQIIEAENTKEAYLYTAARANLELHTWSIARCSTIPAENYSMKDLCKLIEIEILIATPENQPTIEFNSNQNRVILTPTQSFALVCFAESSVLQIMGFEKQSKIRKFDSDRYPCVIDFMVCTIDVPITAKLPPSIHCCTSMWVYSDIVELSAVGDTQAPCLEYLPIQSKMNEMGYWLLHPPYYIKIKEHTVNNIAIMICNDMGEDFPIADGKVTCRLHFRRRPFLV